MQDYDRLPSNLRMWVANAAMPWGPASVRKAYMRALARVGDPDIALQELDRYQAKQLAHDRMRLGVSEP